MKRTIMLAAAVAAMAASAGYRCPTEAEAAELAKKVAAKAHPRLIYSAEDFARFRERAKSADPWTALAPRAVCDAAEHAGKVTSIECRKEGMRLLAKSRDALYRISTLAMAYRIGGEKRHLEAAEKLIRCVSEFPTWNPSHYLDVGEMCLAVATGYDWLHDDLDPEVRELAAKALMEKGLGTGRPVKDKKGRVQFWINTKCNWSQVCHAGLLSAAIAVADRDGAEAAFFIRQAAEKLPIPMGEYAPNGSYPEGPGYWCYGTSFNVIALMAFEKAFGTDFGLSTLPGFAETTSYQDVMTGSSGRFFNYADGRAGRGHDVTVWWLAKRFGAEPMLGIKAAELLEKAAAKAKKRGPGDRLFAFMPGLVTEKRPDAAGYELPRLWTAGSAEDACVMRSAPGEGEWFAAFKAGSPRQNHAHMDSGSFVLDRYGVRWAVDLGAEGYNKIEQLGMSLWNHSQKSDRWKIFRISNASHNVPVVDGELMDVKGRGKILEAKDLGGGASRVAIDNTSLYFGAKSVVRRAEMLPGGAGLAVRDEFKGLKPGAKIKWQFMAGAKAKAEGEKLTLSKNGRTVTVTAPEGSEWKTLEEPAPMPYDSANKGVCQAWFETAASAEGEASIAVKFE